MKKLLNILFIRRPHESELRAANILTSDYQISGLNIQSSILFNFGFASRIYRSKTTFVKFNTKKAVLRYTKIFRNFFACYPDNLSIEDFYKLSQTSSTDISLNYGIQISEIVKGVRNWEKMLDVKLIAQRVAPVIREKYIGNKKLTPSMISNYEPSSEEIKEVKDIVCKLYTILKSGSNYDQSPVKFARRMSLNSSFNNIMSDNFILKPIADVVYNFDEETVGQLKNFVLKYIESQSHDAEKKHSQTVLNEECMKKQEEVLNEIREQGIGDEFTPKTLFEYIVKNDPNAVDRIKIDYNIDITTDTFNNFEELCLYLYEPSMISKIRDSLGVDVRARSKGSVRLGTELSIDKKYIDNNRKRCKEILGDNYDPLKETAKVLKAILNLEEKERLFKGAKTAKDKCLRAYELARLSGNATATLRCKALLEKSKQLTKKLQSDLTYAKKALEKAKKEKDLKNEAVNKLKELSDKELKLLQTVEERNEEDNQGYELAALRKSIEKRKKDEDEIPYCSWVFTIKNCSRRVSLYICNELELSLNKPEDNYVNVTSFEENDEETTFYVDYPKSSKIYKAFNKNENLPRTLMQALKKNIEDVMSLVVRYVGSIKFNVPMESTQL